MMVAPLTSSFTTGYLYRLATTSKAPLFNKCAHPAYDTQKPWSISLHAPTLIGKYCGTNSTNRYTTSAISKIYLRKSKIPSPRPSITAEAASQPCQTLDHKPQLSNSSLTNKHKSGGNKFYLDVYRTPRIAISKLFPQKQTAIISLPRSSN